VLFRSYEQTFDDVVTGNAADATVETLNTYLRGELSAVETYRQAVDKINDEFLRASLHELSVSHEQRVSLLRERIERLGGEPAKSSGVWGGFAKVVEGGAKIFGVKAALAALEEGEDHGLKMYLRFGRQRRLLAGVRAQRAAARTAAQP